MGVLVNHRQTMSTFIPAVSSFMSAPAAQQAVHALATVDPDAFTSYVQDVKAIAQLADVYEDPAADTDTEPKPAPSSLWERMYDSLTTPQAVAVFVVIVILIAGLLVLWYRMLHEVAEWAGGVLNVPPHTLFILFTFTGPVTLLPTALYAIYVSSQRKRR